MKTTIAFAIVSALTLTPAAYAQWERPDRDDYARVIETTPVYSSASREECWNPGTGSYEERRTEIGAGAATAADLDTSQCRMVSESASVVDGYQVRYRYRGNDYVTRMTQDPGDRLLVGRDVNYDGTPLSQIASNDYRYR